MHKNLFGFIWHYSKQQQITALLLTVVSFPFLYFSFDLPKTIINRAIPGEGNTSGLMDIQLFGYNFSELFGFQLTQVHYLFLLCFVLFGLILINGALKMRINTYKGIMAERLLRRMRYMLLERTLRFPLPQFQKTSSGEVVTMVTAEVEPLGGFFGDAFALVAFQGGTFLTIVFFMFMQNPLIGCAALALVPLQGYIIPRLQRKINLLQKQRVTKVRQLSNQVGEVVSSVQEIRAQNQNTHVLSRLSQQLGSIFRTRMEIYQRKFFMKFINNFLTQLTPLLFYSIGGYLAIIGHLSIGALVAALAAYKDMSASWKELLSYYSRLSDARIKYEQLTGQFVPKGLLDSELFGDIDRQDQHVLSLHGALQARSLTVTDEDGFKLLDSATFTLEPGSTTGIISANGTSRTVLTQLLGRVLLPTSGKLIIGEHDLANLPSTITGSRIGLLTAEPAIFNISLADNLFLGLKNRPPSYSDAQEQQAEHSEALASGNSPYDPTRDWINYQAAGVIDRAGLTDKTLQLLSAVELEEDIYQLGLNQRLKTNHNPELIQHILLARSKINERLTQRGLDNVVQNYDFNQYNTYTTVATNILFGKPIDKDFSYGQLAQNPLIMALLEKHQLKAMFFEIGLQSAELMLELFRDIPAGHPTFDQYRFIDEDKLPMISQAVQRARAKKGHYQLSEEDHTLLSGITFHLSVQQHRLGLIDQNMQQQLVRLRHALRKEHPELLTTGGLVHPYDVEQYNPGLNIQDNILFGRIAEGRSGARERVHDAISELVDELGMHKAITELALESMAGIGGSRLSGAQKQKLSIARTLLKQPDVLIANEPMSHLDPEQRQRITTRMRQLLPDSTQVWMSGSSVPEGIPFDQLLRIEAAQVRPYEGSVSMGTLENLTPLTAPNPDDVVASKAGALTEEVQALQELPLFSRLDNSLLKLLAFTSQRTTYLPGELLMRQGEEGDTAHIILSGEVEVFLETQHGEEALNNFGKHTLIGELALLCSTPRTASIRAKVKTVTLQINQEVFSDIAHRDTSFTYQLTRQLGQRLIHTTEELNKLSQKKSEEALSDK